MAHAVPLVFGANFFLKSTNISLCAMSRLDLATFWFSVGCAVPLGLSQKIVKRSLCNSRCAIGIVKKDCQEKSV